MYFIKVKFSYTYISLFVIKIDSISFINKFIRISLLKFSSLKL